MRAHRREVLLRRMLSAQRESLRQAIETSRERGEVARRRMFINASLGVIGVRYGGWLYVRKQKKRNQYKPWKKRWCSLEDGVLTQFYFKNHPKRLEDISLHGRNAKVKVMNGGWGAGTGGSSESSGKGGNKGKGGDAFPHCFSIAARTWEKKGKRAGRWSAHALQARTHTPSWLAGWLAAHAHAPQAHPPSHYFVATHNRSSCGGILSNRVGCGVVSLSGGRDSSSESQASACLVFNH